jgi:hypothetical protein
LSPEQLEAIWRTEVTRSFLASELLPYPLPAVEPVPVPELVPVPEVLLDPVPVVEPVLELPVPVPLMLDELELSCAIVPRTSTLLFT